MRVKNLKPKGLILLRFFLFLLIPILCHCQKSSPFTAETSSGREDETSLPEDTGTTGYNDLGLDEEDGTREESKIALNSNEQLLQIINKNLDLDDVVEQILVIKLTDEVNTPLKITVVDYDPVRENYHRSWEHKTNATNQRAFNLVLEDIIGDYNLEILFTGMNLKNESTMDVFKKEPSRLGLSFIPICQLITPGTIKVERFKRSYTYEHEQKTGKSFPIVLEKPNPQSENSMDLIQEKYEWVYTKKSYELVSTKEIAARVVEQNQLKELYFGGDQEAFKDFLNGPWYNTKDIDTMVFFDRQQDTLVFSALDIQEIYHWDYMRQILYNTLYILARNQNRKESKTPISVVIKSLSSITITIGDISWDGTYNKVNDEFKESLYNRRNYSIGPMDLPLEGKYEHENEEFKILFEPPNFTWITGEKEFSGGYSIIKNIPVLNDYYITRKLKNIPDELTSEQYDALSGGIVSSTSRKNFKSCYQWDRSKKAYLLEEEYPPGMSEKALWDILLSINFNGYKDYRTGVITFKYLKNGISERIENYIFEYTEKEDENEIVRYIALTKGEVSIRGIEAVNDETLMMIQREYLE